VGNLPVELTSFVGRESEVAAVQALMRDTRLLTLTGAGGVGKTRLAMRVAQELTGVYRDGEWLVELAALADPVLLPRLVAQSLGVPERPGQPAASALSDYLRSRQLLLVLDNCEHLVAACAELAENLLRACPELRILTTSREPLGVAGETLWRVPSLAVPDTRSVQGTDEAAGYGAVQLFLDRARSGLPEFTLTDSNLKAVMEICQRLDGVPLALELAAARVRILSPDQIASRLTNRFRLLTDGSRSALPRQQTLRGAMDWSYALLSGADQLLLDRLAVFAGGFTLEGAEAVCSGDGLPIDDVLDTLGRLVDRSLVQREEHPGQARYRLLETVRQYAWERLTARGNHELESVQKRHAAYFLRQAEEAEATVIGPQQAQSLGRIGREHDNMRATLRWALDHEPADGQIALRIARALTLFWEIHSHRTEGLGWLTAALGRHPEAPDAVRAGALKSAGTLAYSLSQFDQSSALLEESLSLYRRLGDRAEVAVLLTRIGRVAHFQGRYAQSTDLLHEAIAEARLLRDDAVLPRAYWFLGETYAAAGSWSSAATTLENALAIAADSATTTRLGI
jgi:non-specific serine/threonine protein kinase